MQTMKEKDQNAPLDEEDVGIKMRVMRMMKVMMMSRRMRAMT